MIRLGPCCIFRDKPIKFRTTTAADFTAHTLQDTKVVQRVSTHTAVGRIGEAEDIAGVAAFLASDDAAWVTGQYIDASGGSGLA